MASKYDLIVVGGGTSGLEAAKTAPENGLKVALLERKTHPARIYRSCAQLFLMNMDSFYNERMYFSREKKKWVFPVNNFSVNYQGNYREFYALHFIGPDARERIEVGDYEANQSGRGIPGTEPDQVQNPFATAPVVAAPTGATAAALVQREVAEVQAAMVIAQRFPRDEKAAMDRILTACTRESLAGAAVYQYARGGSDITGPSIRLAEELARGWGNIVCGVTELNRTSGGSECLAYAWDLQTNFRDEKRFQVRHWRDTKSGGYALRDDRDIYETIANQGARRKRACILAIIPGDVVEAAVTQCELTLKTKADVTPEALHKLLEAFAAYGVTREQIEKRMQRRLDAFRPSS